MMMEDVDKTIPAGDLYPGTVPTVSRTDAEPTQMAVSVECPVCHTPNPPAEVYCMDCGFLLSSTPEERMEEFEVSPPAVLVTQDGTREFTLRVGENTVGRQDADVLLTHNTVSRKHAVVTLEDGKVYVEDIGSTNGTFVGGKKLEPGQRVELANSAEVVFGNQLLILKLVAATQEKAAEEEPPQQKYAIETGQISVQEQETEQAQLVAKLVSEDGKLSYILAPGTYSVGRREGNAIVIPDPYCSGSHAELRVQKSRIEVVDLESTNGTWVNGVRIEPNEPREVQIGDELTFGKTVLRLEEMQ